MNYTEVLVLSLVLDYVCVTGDVDGQIWKNWRTMNVRLIIIYDYRI